MISVYKYLLTFSLYFLSLQLEAAPLPTTGSSYLNKPQTSSVFSQMGFKLDLASTEWVFLENDFKDFQPYTQQIDLGLKTLSSTARLSLKTEALKNRVNFENYIKKFLRDYNQYGFEVLATQTAQINNSKALVIDLRQKNNLTLSRQIFYITEGPFANHSKNAKNSAVQKLTTATCTDTTENFKTTAQLCQSALNSFKWLEQSSVQNKL